MNLRVQSNLYGGRVISRIYRLANSRVGEGHELLRSVAFIDIILRNVTVYALTSSRLDDFSDIVAYILK